MDKYIWLLVVIFIFHDMEEVVGIKSWIRRNYDRVITRFPSAARILAPYKEITTAGMAMAVYEELILLIIICLLADLTMNQILLGLWFGGLLGFTLHLFIHIAQAILIRSYIPALYTSILSIPPSIYLIVRSVSFIPVSTSSILGIIIGILGVAVNLKIAHVVGWRFQRFLQSKEEA
jgi:hypothetical protein